MEKIKMKKYLIILIIILTTSVFAKEKKRINIISGYKENYIVKTLNNKDELKGQISVKMSLLYPESTGVFFGYTNKFWWDIGKESAPFREFNHEPVLFYQANNSNILNIDNIEHIRFGIGHLSNGSSGIDSRSINYFIFISAKYHYQLSTNYQIGGITYLSHHKQNKDNSYLRDYWNTYKQAIFIQKKTKNTIEKEKIIYTIKPTKNFKKYSHSLEIQIRLFSNYIQPYLYSRFDCGYVASGLIDYNKKQLSYYLGIVFK